MSNKLFFTIVGILVGGLAFLALSPEFNQTENKVHTNSRGENHELVSYKDPNCGCCGNWIGFMKAKGYKVEVKDTDDIESVKEKYGIPKDLFSCHTTIVNKGEYFIEGHIPEESIAKLLEEAPNIIGIGMPGMPSGSPGMPGAKVEVFEIMQVDQHQKVNLFESI